MFEAVADFYRNNFPPAPTFTEKELPDQTGKVFIVTGGSAGVGKALASILYAANSTVYIAARSADKTQGVINTIRESHPSSKGALHYLHLDLNDLTTIKASAQDFLSREKRLDVLFNNAGVMVPPQGSKTAQGYELQLGTNCVAPFLFTKLLHSILIRTAALPGTQQGSVRIVWVASSATEHFSPKGGVDMENLDYRSDKAAWTKYGVSKAGNYYHSVETARLLRDKGVVSVALNPGNLKTELTRHVPVWQRYLFEGTLLYDAKFGAYTELFAGLSPEVSMATTGCWIQPWGRIVELRRKDIEAGGKSEEEGGTGIARRFWEWCEGETAKYA